MTNENRCKVGVIQSSYIPWKGYFDIIRRSDKFILYDDCQYSKNDWRNRNQIKTPYGLKWLTIPVQTKSKFGIKIKDVEVSDPDWAETHWKTIYQSYKQSPCFSQVGPFLKEVYERASKETLLSRINYLFLTDICRFVGIKTPISMSMEYDYLKDGNANENLLDLLKQAGAGIYISGPSARNYIDESLFEKNQIVLQWMDYSGYPEYSQLHGAFAHSVSIVDLLFAKGQESLQFLRPLVSISRA